MRNRPHKDVIYSSRPRPTDMAWMWCQVGRRLYSASSSIAGLSQILKANLIPQGLNIQCIVIGWPGMPLLSLLLLSVHPLRNEAEDSHGRHEENQVVELENQLDKCSYIHASSMLRTAFREYALSSASVRASTNRRLRFGRFEGCKDGQRMREYRFPIELAYHSLPERSGGSLDGGGEM